MILNAAIMQSFQIIINGCVCNEYVAALFAKSLEAHWGSIRQFKSRRMTSIWCEVSHRRQSSGCEDVMGFVLQVISRAKPPMQISPKRSFETRDLCVEVPYLLAKLHQNIITMMPWVRLGQAKGEAIILCLF